MTRCGILALGVELFPEFSYLLVVELLPIVGDDGMRNPKPIDDLLPNKILSGLLSNLRERLGLDPLCEVVNGHNRKFILTRT